MKLIRSTHMYKSSYIPNARFVGIIRPQTSETFSDNTWLYLFGIITVACGMLFGAASLMN